MRPQNGKTSKENITHTIYKKKNVKKSKRASNRRNSRVTMESLECINDELRFHQAYGLHGTWKLVPKDSCEVYKDRKRQDSTKTTKEKTNGKERGKRPPPAGRRGRHDPTSSDRERGKSDEESRYGREKRAKRPARRVKKAKNKRCRRQRTKRAPSCESMSSGSCETHSETSLSSKRSSETDC